MELPICSSEQLGVACSYYLMNVNNCGVVDDGETYPDSNVGAHLHAQLDHERVDKKGSNDVTSVVVKTLKDRNPLWENGIGRELNLLFDNCTGKNKNNTDQTLLVYLTETGVFMNSYIDISHCWIHRELFRLPI